MSKKLKTGISGFDHISHGGLPLHRATLVAGTAGSAKTLFAAQFLASGIQNFDEPGVFVTFEETPDDIRENLATFGWDVAGWEAQKKWMFVDVSPNTDDETFICGDFELAAIIARIRHAVKEVNAKRLVLDSLGAFFSQLNDVHIVRRELFAISTALKKMGVTSIVTAERTSDYGDIARFGVEEFVADNVVLLRNPLELEKRRRTIEILKFRGSNHEKGECPFTVLDNEGLSLIPLSSMSLTQRSSETRLYSGVEELDEMCGGGFFRDSIILISGATGTGKSLSVNHFANGAAKQNERALVFAFEESKDQLFRNAAGWGMDFAKLEQKGLLSVQCQYPESAGLEEHIFHMKRAVDAFKPTRVAVDSLSALERISLPKAFREFVLTMSSFLKEREIAGLFTSTTPSLLGGPSITESHISTITDTIILLRYVELNGEMQRGITVLKMRGSAHDKQIRRFVIDHKGMHIKEPFQNVTGILAGHPIQSSAGEIARLDRMFEE
ncbi:MAG: circadian clock protein KaiC [Candidatus Obscuribacterales bacterium]|jgi:circadian clock protein KaiC|nr:circadian clock protein KaiC [Candidatus Obscuribacterales bacterium]